MAKRQTELDALLDLHGEVLVQGGGYWVKIEAWTVEPTAGVPHGIRYSLTLHDPSGTPAVEMAVGCRVPRNRFGT